MTYAHIVGLLFVGFFCGIAFASICLRPRDTAMERLAKSEQRDFVRRGRDLAREALEEGHPEDLS